MPGMVYGVAWWLIIFVAAQPMLHMTKPIRELSTNTIISELCLYLLWGLFIGYTAAEEFTNERMREPEAAH
ncbi:hypothetical protein D3C80_1859320 [compost metagenome]